MTGDTTIIPFHQPGSIIDPLTEIARDGARRMLMAALKAEADGFVARFSEDLLADGRQRIVRHGAGPERVIQTGIGPIEVRRQKVRDRATDVPAEAKIRFTSNILPKWARRVISRDALLPVLYLRGISTGDFQEALSALPGPDAPNLSPGVIAGSRRAGRRTATAGWPLPPRRLSAPLGRMLRNRLPGNGWRTGVPAGGRRGVPGTRHQRLVPQDFACSEQVPEVHGPGGHRGFHGKLRDQIRSRPRLADHGH